MLAGFPEAAEEALRAACESLQRQHQTALLATRAAELADSICEQSRYQEADVWADLARESAGGDDLDAGFAWRYAKARILTGLGALAEAEGFAREALDIIGRTDALNRHADALVVLAEVCRAAGREADALEKTQLAVELYQRKGNVVSAARARGKLLGVAASE